MATDIDPDFNAHEQFIKCCKDPVFYAENYSELITFLTSRFPSATQQAVPTETPLNAHLIEQGFSMACHCGNIAAIEELINNKFYEMNREQNIYSGVLQAAYISKTDTLRYFLETYFDKEFFSSMNPVERQKNTDFLCSLLNITASYARPQNGAECVNYLTHYLEGILDFSNLDLTTNINDITTASTQKQPMTLLEKTNYKEFKTAATNDNIVILEFFITHYNLTGCEPQLQEMLTGPHPYSILEEPKIQALLLVNREKAELGKQINPITTTTPQQSKSVPKI